MSNRKIVLALILISIACGLKLNHQATLGAGKVNLQSDIGKYLSRCNNCGPGASPDSASLHETNPANPWATWSLEVVGSQVAFKADTGKYLSRCNNCWRGGASPDSAFVHVTSLAGNPYALWTPIDLGNGKWAFKADTGKFLARCNGCVPTGAYPNFAFVHSTNQNDAWAQWTVSYVFPAGPVNIQADTGKYLSRCNNCGPGASPDSASIHETNPANGYAIWTVQKVGSQVAFKADTGKYLSRCNNCWRGGASPDSAFVHVTSLAGNPYALWTPISLPNGKWALKADTGKFLARCNGCVPTGAYPDFAFVHSTNQNDAWAQWAITTR